MSTGSMTRLPPPKLPLPAPPAGPHDVFFKPPGGRWRRVGTYPTREQAAAAMYAGGGSGGWRLAPVAADVRRPH